VEAQGNMTLVLGNGWPQGWATTSVAGSANQGWRCFRAFIAQPSGKGGWRKSGLSESRQGFSAPLRQADFLRRRPCLHRSFLKVGDEAAMPTAPLP
jgi:hypothetical protein